ncbi:glycosyltransferase [Nonomuraea sp. NPDC050536]|uniref:glycosyltransferase n=1 Tax=Nonomuraea sp. NPDC050536 TaxID=3364366 RepID=UPI0037C7E539
MRILLVGPRNDGDSIPPYLDVLQHGLAAAGATVARLGSAGPPYDEQLGRFWTSEQIIAAASTLADADLRGFDVVSLHFGNLEIEQLLPLLWRDRERPPIVYHVHSLAPTLFRKHVPDPGLSAAVADSMHRMDGYVYFGQYAARTLPTPGPYGVAFLPTTIPAGTPVPAVEEEGRLLASLYGYPAPWKDAAGLIAALAQLRQPVRFHLAGPFWDDPSQAGAALQPGASRHGRAHLTVAPTYMDAVARAALVAASSVGVFPYQPVATFQGSGAVADYLAHGVPVIATDVANMAELAGPAGVIVPPGDPAALAAALDRFAGDPDHRAALTSAAADRARLFTGDAHAAACLGVYEQLLHRRT